VLTCTHEIKCENVWLLGNHLRSFTLSYKRNHLLLIILPAVCEGVCVCVYFSHALWGHESLESVKSYIKFKHHILPAKRCVNTFKILLGECLSKCSLLYFNTLQRERLFSLLPPVPIPLFPSRKHTQMHTNTISPSLWEHIPVYSAGRFQLPRHFQIKPTEPQRSTRFINAHMYAQILKPIFC